VFIPKQVKTGFVCMGPLRNSIASMLVMVALVVRSP